MNNIDDECRDTNNNSQIKHDAIDEPKSDAVEQVTVNQLEQQVDDLVDNYNKLAKTLNRPQIHEANADGIQFSSLKTVSVGCNINAQTWILNGLC